MKTIYNLQFTIYKKGFTMIELLIAISIIGILSSFLLANFVGVRQRARDGVRKSDLRQLQSAFELHRADQGLYPASLPSCGSSLSAGSPAVIYMQKIPCDPSNGASYFYDDAATSTRYCIRACLENSNDADRDELPTKFNANNPSIPGCTTAASACPTSPKKPSYTLQNP